MCLSLISHWKYIISLRLTNDLRADKITHYVVSIIIRGKHIHGHDDVIKWKHFPRYLPFLRGIHRSPVNSPHKGQRRGALMFSLICTRINSWVNNREAGDLRRNSTHYDVIIMWKTSVELVNPGCIKSSTLCGIPKRSFEISLNIYIYIYIYI